MDAGEDLALVRHLLALVLGIITGGFMTSDKKHIPDSMPRVTIGGKELRGYPLAPFLAEAKDPWAAKPGAELGSISELQQGLRPQKLPPDLEMEIPSHLRRDMCGDLFVYDGDDRIQCQLCGRKGHRTGACLK